MLFVIFLLIADILKKSLSDTDKKLRESSDHNIGNLIHEKDYLEKSLKSLNNTTLAFDEEIYIMKSNLMINHPVNDDKNEKKNSLLSPVKVFFESQLFNLNQNINLLNSHTKIEDIREIIDDLIQDTICNVNNIFSKLQSIGIK